MSEGGKKVAAALFIFAGLHSTVIGAAEMLGLASITPESYLGALLMVISIALVTTSWRVYNNIEVQDA